MLWFDAFEVTVLKYNFGLDYFKTINSSFVFQAMEKFNITS